MVGAGPARLHRPSPIDAAVVGRIHNDRRSIGRNGQLSIDLPEQRSIGATKAASRSAQCSGRHHFSPVHPTRIQHG
jgi:hypothetical protein